MTNWKIIYDPFDPGPRRLESDGYALFLVAHNDDEVVMAQAEISGLALRFDMTDADRAWIWPAVAKVAARDLAVHIRDGARTEGTGALRIPVGGSSVRAAAVTGSELVAVEPGTQVATFDDD